eukprot:g11526.t1
MLHNSVICILKTFSTQNDTTDYIMYQCKPGHNIMNKKVNGRKSLYIQVSKTVAVASRLSIVSNLSSCVHCQNILSCVDMIRYRKQKLCGGTAHTNERLRIAWFYHIACFFFSSDKQLRRSTKICSATM